MITACPRCSTPSYLIGDVRSTREAVAWLCECMSCQHVFATCAHPQAHRRAAAFTSIGGELTMRTDRCSCGRTIEFHSDGRVLEIGQDAEVGRNISDRLPAEPLVDLSGDRTAPAVGHGGPLAVVFMGSRVRPDAAHVPHPRAGMVR